VKRKRWLIVIVVLLGICVVIGLLASIGGGGKNAPPATTQPTATVVPTSIPLPTATVEPTVSADVEAWRTALADHMAKTVCSPTTDAAYPRPDWCDKILGVSLVKGVLTVRTSATTTEEAKLMSQGFSSFAFNNLYKQFGIKSIKIVSDADGKILYER
jgi:Flp pilus assembly protein CpaB